MKKLFFAILIGILLLGIVGATQLNLDLNSIGADVDGGMSGTAQTRDTAIKWDISSIPAAATIGNATLCIYASSAGTPSNFLNVSYVQNQTWNESLTYTEFDAKINGTKTLKRTLATSTGTGDYHCFEVTDLINEAYANNRPNATIYLERSVRPNAYNFVADGTTFKIGSNADNIQYVSREGTAGQTPTLNITYTGGAGGGDTANPLIQFVNPSFIDGILQRSSRAFYNVSIIEPNLKNVSVNWNGTNVKLMDGLIYFYNFNNLSALGESNSKIVDLSPWGNNATNIGDKILWGAIAGRNSGGFLFDGRNTSSAFERLQPKFGFNVDVNGTIRDNFTISVWAKPENYFHADTSIIIELFGYSGWIRWTKGSNQILMNVNNMTWNGTAWKGSDTNVVTTSPAGQWVNLIFMRKGNDIRGYKDGVLFQNKTITGNPMNRGRNTTIGGSAGYPQFDYLSFNGSIDDLMVWNTTFTDQQITEIYSSQLQKLNSTLWLLGINHSLSSQQTGTIQACASDDSNNANCTETRSIYADFTSPTLTIISPTASTYTYNNLSFNLTVSEAAQSCQFIMNETKRGLVSFWTFDNGARDIIGSNHGTVAGGNPTQTYNSKFGQAYKFNGINDLFSIPASYIDNQNATYSMWVNGDTYTGDRIGKLGCTYFFQRNTGKFYMTYRNASGGYQTSATTSNGALGSWQLVTFKTEQQGNKINMTIYINGVLDSNNLGNGFKTASCTGGQIGQSDNINWYNGTIDEVQAYSRVLSNNEIAEIYSAQAVNMGNTSTIAYNYIYNNIPEGLQSLTFVCNDTLNNTGSAHRYFGIDTIPPMIDLISPLSTRFFNSIRDIFFNFTATAGAGIDTCGLWGDWAGGTFKLNISKTGIISGTPNFFIQNVSAGAWKWNTGCNDTLGIFDYSAQGNQTFIVDTTYPKFTILYPQNISYAGAVVGFNFSITETYIEDCWYSLDRGITNISTACGENITGVIADVGSNTWTIYANDSAGNKNSSSVTFYAAETIGDTTPPTLTIVSPLAITYNISNIDFNVSIDEEAITCSYSLDGAAGVALTQVSPTYYWLNVSGIADGAHSAIFSCNDTSENTGTASVSFDVDTSTPAAPSTCTISNSMMNSIVSSVSLVAAFLFAVVIFSLMTAFMARKASTVTTALQLAGGGVIFILIIGVGVVILYSMGVC